MSGNASLAASPADELITGVDDAGGFYPVEKLAAHCVSIRHLAISVFLFDGTGRLLLQRRADGKYHSGGLWANSCCSHPRWNEGPGDCARRRLQEELGLQAPLEEFAVLDYAAPVGRLYENEVVHCFRGRLDAATDLSGFNPAEVQATAWMSLPALAADLELHPQNYAAWLHIYMRRHADPAGSFKISTGPKTQG
jgi:isopentenyl-diphosphate Delta-isomerase